MAHVEALSRNPVALLLDTNDILDAQRQNLIAITGIGGNRRLGTITTTVDGLKQIKIYCRNRTFFSAEN